MIIHTLQHMGRLTAIAVFSLSIRIFSAPSLCTHNMVEIQSEMLTAGNAHASMEHCHKKMNAVKAADSKQAPCNHMKQCLLDATDDVVFQKSADTLGLSSVQIPVYSMVAIYGAPLLEASAAETHVFTQPPPRTLYFHTPVYISISSFLI